jgi:hypothetical protein
VRGDARRDPDLRRARARRRRSRRSSSTSSREPH